MNSTSRLAVAAWLLGAAGFAFLGWNPDLPLWRMLVAGLAATAMATGIAMAAWKDRGDANAVAMLATLALAAVWPAPVGDLLALAGILASTAAIVTGYYILQLALRTDATAGPFLKHGAFRITATVAIAALVALLVVVGLRLGAGALSLRWDASLDVASPQLLVTATAALLALVTALSMLAVSRIHADEDEPDANGSRDAESKPERV